MRNHEKVKFTRHVILLCPVCHNIEPITISINHPSLTVAPILAGKAECPSCGNDMFLADDALIDALICLHKSNITAFAHCDRYHSGDCHQTLHRNDNGWFLGPFIGVTMLSKEQIATLIKGASTYGTYCNCCHIVVTNIGVESSNIEFANKEASAWHISVHISNPHNYTIRLANVILTDFIQTWTMYLRKNHVPGLVNREIPDELRGGEYMMFYNEYQHNIAVATETRRLSLQ